VSIARGKDEFVRHCEKALDQPDAEAIVRGLKMARQNSWDSIVAELENHTQEALRRKRAGG
jgi:predicted kinase